MITGDHKETALAIAKQLGITDQDNVCEGRELEKMSDYRITRDWWKRLMSFARTSPQNKLKLVESIAKKMGHSLVP